MTVDKSSGKPELSISAMQMSKFFVANRITAFLCFAICMLSVSMGEANARLIINEQTKTYNVSGKSGKQVHAKFGRRGPWKMRRKHAIAATQRKFDFKNIKIVKRGNKCVFAKMDIYLSLTYYYPNWINKSSASKKTQRLWGSFMRELVRHEKTHGKFFKETLRQFEKELVRISRKSFKSCRQMNAIALRKLETIYKKGEVRHLAFDRREGKPSAKIRKLEKAFLKSK